EPDLMVAAVDLPSDAVTHFELPSNPPPTPAQVQEAAEVANVDRHLLGQILVDQFKVAQTHVDEAIARQQAGDNRPIGAILMTLGAVSPKVVADAVEHQHRLREESQRQ